MLYRILSVKRTWYGVIPLMMKRSCRWTAAWPTRISSQLDLQKLSYSKWGFLIMTIWPKARLGAGSEDVLRFRNPNSERIMSRISSNDSIVDQCRIRHPSVQRWSRALNCRSVHQVRWLVCSFDNRSTSKNLVLAVWPIPNGTLFNYRNATQRNKKIKKHLKWSTLLVTKIIYAIRNFHCFNNNFHICHGISNKTALQLQLGINH